MIPTHVVTLNGDMSIPVLDVDGPPEAEIAGYLSRLDGEELFAVALWRLPDGFGLGSAEAYRASDDNYLQSAGSATGMTVEMRSTVDGVARQFAVGKGTSVRSAVPDAEVRFGRQTVKVFGDEVFTADEAADIYRHYFASGELPTDLLVRELARDL